MSFKPPGCLLLLLSLASLAARADEPRPVDLEADTLTYEPSTGHTLLVGHATLRSGDLVLRADEIDYDRAGERARAQGQVVFAQGLWGGTALSLDLDLLRQVGELGDATFYQKKWTSPQAVAGAATPAEMRAVGRNALTLRAESVSRKGPTRYQAEHILVTPCDCGANSPSWSVRARRADVLAGERIVLSWPVIYIKNLPVLPLPALYLPLSDRRTGFLLPRPNYTARNGFQLEEPFFWAVNGWSDATFTPGYFFGGPTADGMRGPRLGTELRYVPAEGTRGTLTAGIVDDFKHGRSARGDLAWTHEQKLPWALSDRVDVAAVSDQAYFRDITADVVASQAQYLRSTARLERRGESTAAWLDGAYYQDLTLPPPAGSLGRFIGPQAPNNFTFQRLPALSFDLEEVRVGPVVASFEGQAVRYAPLRARIGLPADLPAAARQEATRLDLSPEARAPVVLGRFIQLAPYAQLRADGWLLEGSATTGRAYGAVGATAETELARTYGDGPVRWRHAITPAAEIRSVPWSKGRGPEVPNDEIDAALPEPSLLQALASVRTRLDRREGGLTTEPLRLEAGQGYDLARGVPADSFARGAWQSGPVQADGLLHYDLHRRRFAYAGLGLAGGPAWLNGYARYERLDPAGTDAMRAALVDLVGQPASAASNSGQLAEQLILGARARPWQPLSVEAEATLLPHASDPFPAPPRLLTYRVALGYRSPCDCWSVYANALFGPPASVRALVPLGFFFVLDAQRLGGG